MHAVVITQKRKKEEVRGMSIVGQVFHVDRVVFHHIPSVYNQMHFFN